MTMKDNATYQIIKLLADAPESQVAPTVLEIFQNWANNPPTADKIVEVRNYLSYSSLASDFVISTLNALEAIKRKEEREAI